MNALPASRFSRMIFLLLLSLPVVAQVNEKPVVSVEHVAPFFKVYSSIVLPLTTCHAYQLLTDYKSLPD